MVTARTPQEEVVLGFFRTLNTGDLEAIRATLHPEATWQPMVEGIPGAGIQRVMGHTSETTSRRHYRHSIAKNLTDTVAGFDY